MSNDRTKVITKATTVEIGTELNQTYKIDALLGVGGMGEVFKGHNLQTGDPVAIKVVLPEFARDEMIYELFRKEARVLNHLNHDAIVRYYVFSLDRVIGRPYLAMEYVDGPSLAVQIKKNPLPPELFFSLLSRLADGLHRAHEAGVIHRDISPDNVILPDGLVEKAKIIDFGIARSANVGGGTLLGGSFAGKYSYVSPEQLGLYGGEVTPKSDIYSLGLMMAAAVRGEPINMSGSQVEVIEKRRTVPQLSGIGIPKQFHAVLTAMLQPDPADRPESMAAVRDWDVAGGSKTNAKTSRLSKPPKSRFTSQNQGGQAQPRQPSSAFRNAAMGLGIVAVIGVGALGGWIYVQNQKQAQAPSPAAQIAQTSAAPAQATPAPAESQTKPSEAAPATPLPAPVAPVPEVKPASTPLATPEAAPLPVVTPPAAEPKVEPATTPVLTEATPPKLPAPAPKIETPPIVAEVPSPPKATEAAPSIVATPDVKTAELKPAATPSVSAPEVKNPQVAMINQKPPIALVPNPPKVDEAALRASMQKFSENTCIHASIDQLAENSAKLSVIGNENALPQFENLFTQKAGFKPQIKFDALAPAQCEFLGALNKVAPKQGTPLQIKLSRTELRGNNADTGVAGDPLSVTVSGVGDRNAYLFLVDHEGGIQSMNRACPSCIKIKDGAMMASLSLFSPASSEGSATPAFYPMMVFVAAASKPLNGINGQDAFDSADFTAPLLKDSSGADDFSMEVSYLKLKPQ